MESSAKSTRTFWSHLRGAPLFWLAVAFAFCVGARYAPHIVPTDSFVSDSLFKIRASHYPYGPKVADVVVVEFDDRFLAQLPYRNPVDRCVIARALHEINTYQPSVIGLDLLVDVPTEPAKDKVFVEVAKSLKERLVIASFSSSLGGSYDAAAFLRERGIPRSQIASATLQKDYDATVRTAVDTDAGLYPTLARALADRFHKQGHAPVPLQAQQPRLIDWTAHPHEGVASIPRLPIWYFLRNAASPFRDCPALRIDSPPIGSDIESLITSAIKDKVVIIGANIGDANRHITPLDLSKNTRPKLAGVHIHADITQQFIHGRSIGQPGFPETCLSVWGVLLFCHYFNSILRTRFPRYAGAGKSRASSPISRLLDFFLGDNRAHLDLNPYPALMGIVLSAATLGAEYAGIVYFDYALPSGLWILAIGLIFGAEFIHLVRDDTNTEQKE